MPTCLPRRILALALTFAGAALLWTVFGAAVPVLTQTKKDFSVTARKYSYKVEGSDKPEIHVQEGDLVRITFSSEDIPHSFTIVDDDHYRIMRRVEAGKPVTFEFLADKAGRFTFRCTLRTDERCNELVGTLFVAAKR